MINNAFSSPCYSRNQRYRLISIISSSLFFDEKSLLGIEVLLEEGVYEAAYPLHDQLIPKQDAGEPETWNDRMVERAFLDDDNP